MRRWPAHPRAEVLHRRASSLERTAWAPRRGPRRCWRRGRRHASSGSQEASTAPAATETRRVWAAGGVKRTAGVYPALMHSRAAELIRNLGLAAHPEGGAYREVFRATRRVTSAEGRSCAAVTTIYFLLLETQYSRWHRVAQDEVWHFYEGDPLELLWFEPAFERLEDCARGSGKGAVGGEGRAGGER